MRQADLCVRQRGPSGPRTVLRLHHQGGRQDQDAELRPGPVLSKIEREVQTYKMFRATCDQLVAVSDAICDARPVEAGAMEKKRRSPPRSMPSSSAKSKR